MLGANPDKVLTTSLAIAVGMRQEWHSCALSGRKKKKAAAA